MRFDEYQERAIATHIGPSSLPPEAQCALMLASKAGSVVETIRKAYSDQRGMFLTPTADAICIDLGDMLWCITQLADLMKVDLERVAAMNLDRLASRNADR